MKIFYGNRTNNFMSRCIFLYLSLPNFSHPRSMQIKIETNRFPYFVPFNTMMLLARLFMSAKPRFKFFQRISAFIYLACSLLKTSHTLARVQEAASFQVRTTAYKLFIVGVRDACSPHKKQQREQ